MTPIIDYLERLYIERITETDFIPVEAIDAYDESKEQQ